METKLLIAEDHPAVREALRIILLRAGFHQVVEVTTCEELVRAVNERSLDLLLLDLSLRDGDSLKALPQIKEIDESLPVLIHSLRDSPLALRECYEQGAQGYIVKGQDPKVLIQTIEKAASGDDVWTEEQMEQIHDIASI